MKIALALFQELGGTTHPELDAEAIDDGGSFSGIDVGPTDWSTEGFKLSCLSFTPHVFSVLVGALSRKEREAV